MLIRLWPDEKSFFEGKGDTKWTARIEEGSAWFSFRLGKDGSV